MSRRFIVYCTFTYPSHHCAFRITHSTVTHTAQESGLGLHTADAAEIAAGSAVIEVCLCLSPDPSALFNWRLFRAVFTTYQTVTIRAVCTHACTLFVGGCDGTRHTFHEHTTYIHAYIPIFACTHAAQTEPGTVPRIVRSDENDGDRSDSRLCPRWQLGE